MVFSLRISRISLSLSFSPSCLFFLYHFSLSVSRYINFFYGNKIFYNAFLRQVKMDGETYDVIVVGSGLPHSVLAAALARAGKRVAHVDTHPYYGDLWTSLSLKEFFNWLNEPKGFEANISIPSPFQTTEFKRACYSPTCKGNNCYSPGCRAPTWQTSWNKCLRKAREFSIDLWYPSLFSFSLTIM